MKLQHPHDCSCHGPAGLGGSRQPGPSGLIGGQSGPPGLIGGSPSTGYFVLGLSLLLVLAGLFQTGVLRIW